MLVPWIVIFSAVDSLGHRGARLAPGLRRKETRQLGLHGVIGTDMQGLLYIEYGFHVSQMFGGAILAYSFLNLFRKATSSI